MGKLRELLWGKARQKNRVAKTIPIPGTEAEILEVVRVGKDTHFVIRGIKPSEFGIAGEEVRRFGIPTDAKLSIYITPVRIEDDWLN